MLHKLFCKLFHSNHRFFTHGGILCRKCDAGLLAYLFKHDTKNDAPCIDEHGHLLVDNAVCDRCGAQFNNPGWTKAE